MTMSDTSGPTIDLDSGTYRVVSWNPPHLVLECGDDRRTLFVSSTKATTFVGLDGSTHAVARGRRSNAQLSEAESGHDDLTSPMPGKVLEVLVAEGDTVESGQRLLILEAMKMESPIRAPHDSVVTKLHVAVGDTIAGGDTLIELDSTALGDAPADGSTA